jgi:hypothetical protein
MIPGDLPSLRSNGEDNGKWAYFEEFIFFEGVF